MMIRCILRVWGALVRTWTESIAPLLTHYVHHIPLEPTPCIFRHRWRLNHMYQYTRRHAPSPLYGVFWGFGENHTRLNHTRLNHTRLNHMSFESYEFWIIPGKYMMNTRIPDRTSRNCTVDETRYFASRTRGRILMNIIKKECIIKKSLLLKRVYY